MQGLLILYIAAFAVTRVHAKDDPIPVEAEGFAQRGGWVVDLQFMDTSIG